MFAELATPLPERNSAAPVRPRPAVGMSALATLMVLLAATPLPRVIVRPLPVIVPLLVRFPITLRLPPEADDRVSAPLEMFKEKNTADNLPAQIDVLADTTEEHADEYSFLFIAKGGGSANKSFLFQQSPAVLSEGILHLAQGIQAPPGQERGEEQRGYQHLQGEAHQRQWREEQIGQR